MACVDNYEVFINFRGADTRQGFVKILYDDLVAEGVRVFLDNEELNYGRRLDEELPQAINNSKIYITVISRTYASSKWCLRELAEIVRNVKQFKGKKEILPVFYKITPDDVKLKTNLFNDQLNSIKEKVRVETVEEWVEALKGIPEVRGWSVPIHGGYNEDAEFCRQIVKRTSVILRVKHKPLPKDLIGMEDPVQEVMQLLDIGNPGLQIIGIHGMGGIGKTTLAKVVYNKLCDDKFDCCCFMPDVRESLDKDNRSRAYLDMQKKLLKEVSYRGDVDGIRDVEDGIRRIQLTLEGKKVLLVFDDVSKADQIVRLIGDNYTMFGRESRIFITTRDDRVVRSREFAKFTKMHEMKAMDNDHALELFSWHAFGEPTPPEGYSLLSNEAVSLTERLPLSVKITGSLFFLGGRTKWKQIVKKLKNTPNDDVQKRLKISYDDLEDGTKEIFLDIACFFVDKKRSHEFYMWDACGFFSELAIEELISMCLIKIDDDDQYRMHDHIKDLGREIVRKEGPKDKEQRSRIWNKQDAMDILTIGTKKENNKIEGIHLEGLNYHEILTLREENCVNLDMLRFLHLDGSNSLVEEPAVQLEGSFGHVLPNLRWLSLPCMKMKPLYATNFFFFWSLQATNFNLKKLVVLNLSRSNVTESWAMFKDLPLLKALDLSFCDALKKTPDLSSCTSLKTLLLSNCRYLEEIDGSIRSLRKLRHLDLSYCEALKMLPNSIGELVKLEVLLLVGCTSLVTLPNSLTSLPKLRHLDLAWSNRLESLPESVEDMVDQQLTYVNISGLVELKKLPKFISKQKKLEVLHAYSSNMLQGVFPTEIGELTCLREISFDFSSICGLPSLVKLSRLEILSLRGCSHLQQLPAQLPTSLVELQVSSTSLQSIPDYSYLINLTDLEFHLGEWEEPEPVPVVTEEMREEVQELNVNWIWRLAKLKNLWLSMSTNFTTTIQSEESSSLQLEQLTLRCSVTSGTCIIPSFLSALRRLEVSLYRGTSLFLPRLNRLTRFILSKSDDLTQIHGLGELESLISLEITKCNSLERLDDISKLRQLLTLEIYQCKKLRVISVVPYLRSLKKLEIIKCESLESLVDPSDSESCLDDLHLVERLNIVGCPLLESTLPEELVEKMSSRFRYEGGSGIGSGSRR